MEMDKETTLILIQLYENQNLLWNPKHMWHFNKTKKMNAWQEIADGCNLTVDEAKKKISSLLGSFRREKRKGIKTIGTGEGATEIYKSDWYAFKNFSFLLNKDEPRASISSEKKSEECEPKPKYLKLNSSADEHVRLPTQRLKTSEDCCQQIATVWSNKLSKMDRNQRIFAERVINEIMFNGQLGLLNYSTKLTNLNSIRQRKSALSSFNRNKAIINTNDSLQDSHLTNYENESNDEVADQESVQSAENYVKDYDPLEDSVKLEN